MTRPLWLLPLAFALRLSARELPPLPAELSPYLLEPAPETSAPLLKRGDRLAICGEIGRAACRERVSSPV